MNKLNRFALMSAIALTGAAGFTACSSEGELANTNPTFDGESVKTQFTINVPAASKSTRLGTDIVQGQDDPVFRGMDNINMFAFATGGTDAAEEVEGTDMPKAVYTNMGSILAEGDLMENSNAKVYYNLDIPATKNINRFIFYGEATRDGGNDLAGNQTNGVLTPNYTELTDQTALSTLHFDLKQIVAQASDATTPQGTITTQLNNVAGVSGWSSSTGDLKLLYDNFIKLKAGSANSVRAALTMLNDGVGEVSGDDTETLRESIKSAISTALTAIESNTFPRDLGLPDGAVQIAWSSDDSQFEVAVTSDGVWGGQLQATPVTDFVFPAALYYWTSSPIKASDAIQSDKYGTSSWDYILTNLYGSASNSVSSTTQSVALTNKINYAVARFDVKAAFAAATVQDNNGEDVTITASGENHGISIVGLLVGGQKNVQYDFSTPVTQAAEKAIYDSSITSTALSTSNTNVIAQTLALETEKDQTKRFAIELENNTGAAFNGYDGIVPAGGRFYLVGELKPKTETELAEMEGRVFKQDHVTIATVTINSLAHAYNTIPDLKEPKLELGLSVDLEWQQGLKADVVIN